MDHRDRKTGSLLALIMAVCLLSSPAYAIFGFGVHAGKDFASINEKTFGVAEFQKASSNLDGIDITPQLANWNKVTLKRDGVSAPWLVGAHFYIDIIPFIDVEASVDAALAKYKVIYDSDIDVLASQPADETQDVYFGRVGVYLTARHDLVKLPAGIFALYIGGGLGYHLVAPVAGADLIVNAFGNGDPTATKPKLSDLVDREGEIGWHGLFGVRVKAPIIPIALRLEAKYTATNQTDMDKPGAVFSTYLGVSFAI